MPLSPEEREILQSLSEPLEPRRRHEFLQEAERRIGEASQGETGVGLVHRIARATQRDFYDAPDLRVGRVGPRG
jgi:hypothetical protein